VVGIFKHKNPGNALLLILYGLVLKFPLFLHPIKPLPQQGDNFIYTVIVRFLDPVAGKAPIIYSLLAFLLFFTQATLLNRIANSLKLFPKQNYLVGMSLILVTSLMKDWTSFSAPLLVNSLMIWIWYRLIGLYSNSNPKTSIYNVSVLVGLTPLIYSPAIAFLLMLFTALIITRPLRVAEWLVAIMGILTPYYFLFVILFMTDQWQISKIISNLTFYLPGWPTSLWIIGSLVLLFVPFLSGAYFVQKNLNKMLIQVRKAWSLVLVFLVVSLLIIFLNPRGGYLHWMLVVVPLATFHAATYYYTGSRWFAGIVHWLTFAFAILVTYGVFDNLVY
jgi:hypothetical protein